MYLAQVLMAVIYNDKDLTPSAGVQGDAEAASQATSASPGHGG
jgi:hypothetical protein